MQHVSNPSGKGILADRKMRLKIAEQELSMSIPEHFSSSEVFFNNLHNIQFVISDQLFLDVLLMKIRSKTISYATMKKRVSGKGKGFAEQYPSLDTKIKLTEDEKGKLESYKQELIALREKKMEGVLLRSRARWVAEGEKITKYFCLKNVIIVSKQMIRLTLNNGEEIYETKDMEVKMFYERLYSDRQLEDCEILDLVEDIPTLTVQEKTSLEGEITLDEASVHSRA